MPRLVEIPAVGEGTCRKACPKLIRTRPNGTSVACITVAWFFGPVDCWLYAVGILTGNRRLHCVSMFLNLQGGDPSRNPASVAGGFRARKTKQTKERQAAGDDDDCESEENT